MQFWEKMRRLIIFLIIVVNGGQMLLSVFYFAHEYLVQHIMLCLVYVALHLKVIAFVWNWNTVLELEDSLKTISISFRISRNYSVLFGRNIKFVNTLANVDRYLILGYSFYFCFYKLLFNRNVSLILYDGLLPCDKKNKICDTVIYASQTIFSFICVLLNTNLECLFSKFVTIFVCLVDILQEKLDMLEFSDTQKAATGLRSIVKLHIEILR